MEIDYIFPLRIFSSKKSARAKILTEWKTALCFCAEVYLEPRRYDKEGDTTFFLPEISIYLS